MKLAAATLALLAGFGLPAASARAQSDEDCSQYGDDAIAVRACVNRQLDEADHALADARNELRALLREGGAVDGRRDAAALDVTVAAWRNWRDAECALRAAVAPDTPLIAAPVVCAVEMTRARTEVVLAYTRTLSGQAVAELEPEPEPTPEPASSASPPSPPAPPAPAVVAEASFQDWAALCLSDGRCEAATHPIDGPAGAELHIARARLDAPWRVAARLSEDADWSEQGFAFAVDDGEAISLVEWAPDTVLELMRRGLVARADADTSPEVTVDFSLRGLTAAMNWIEDTQIDADRTN